MRLAVISVLLALGIIGLTSPVRAGGFATVRLDAPPGDIVAGEPWRVGFTVRQHDVTPTNDVSPVVRAVNVKTGEEISVPAHQDGPVGHFVAELTLPTAGPWKWAVYPDPYPETTFESLQVVSERSASLRFTATLQRGSCLTPGDDSAILGEIPLRPSDANGSRSSVEMGADTVDAPLADLLTNDHVIVVGAAGQRDMTLACGDLTTVAPVLGENPDEIVLRLQSAGASRPVGLAILQPSGETTLIKLYMLDTTPSVAEPATVHSTVVEIVGGGSGAWMFQPGSLTISQGDTVSWLNSSDSAHTITSDDLNFANSSVLDPGQMFHQTFTETGTFQYRCGPHPWMEGTIVVE